MFRKFHWGWGIGVFYSAFVVFMLFMVWRSTQMKTDLVTADYYGKELKYQEQLDKMKRSNSLGEPLRWLVKRNAVTLDFPQSVKDKKVEAAILFYRPDNSLRDFTVNCEADT